MTDGAPRSLSGVLPPIDGRGWLIGDERPVSNILLHGATGETELTALLARTR